MIIPEDPDPFKTHARPMMWLPEAAVDCACEV